MSYTKASTDLTHAGTLAMLQAAAAKAEEIGQPQCIVVVDASGEILGQLRMTGAKFLSLKSAATKARTAASINGPSNAIPEDFRAPIAAATQNAVTGIGGGLPIRFGGDLAGAIGVGSGTAEQDIEVGRAALAAVGADADV